jgi:hypothetical protein
VGRDEVETVLQLDAHAISGLHARTAEAPGGALPDLPKFAVRVPTTLPLQRRAIGGMVEETS